MVDVIRYGMGYCEEGLYANRIIVPSYSSDGELNYFVGRDIYEGGMKYKNPPVSKDIVGLNVGVGAPKLIGCFNLVSFKVSGPAIISIPKPPSSFIILSYSAFSCGLFKSKLLI